MSASGSGFFVGLICLAPVVAALAQVVWRRHLREQRSEAPFPELSRRPAGEALRVKLLELDDKISERLVWLIFPAILVSYFAWVARNAGLAVTALPAILSWIWSTFVGRQMYSLIQQRGKYQLGYDGERFVAEELKSPNRAQIRTLP